MKKFKKLIAGIAAATMVLSMSFASFADNKPVIDTTEEGSITVTKYQYNNGDFTTGTATGTENDKRTDTTAVLEGVEFTLYQVVSTTDTYNYYNGTNDDAYTVDQFVETNDQTGDKTSGKYKLKSGTKVYDGDTEVSVADAIVKETDDKGVIEFTDLPVGMYVLIETSTDNTKPNDNTVKTYSEPALISIPMVNTYDKEDGAQMSNDNTYWMYDVNVYPKNETFGASIKIQKNGSSDGTDGTALKDVTFKLTKYTSDTYATIDTNAATTYDTDELAAGETKDGISTATTDADGKIEKFTDIPAGYYQLEEVSAPDGYIVNRTPIRFVVNPDNSITCTTEFTGLTLTDGTAEELDATGTTSDDEMDITLVNEKPTMAKSVLVDQTDGSKVDAAFDPSTAAAANWGESADYSIGDTVYYKLDVYVPANINYLEKFEIVDTPDGLTDVAVSSIKYGTSELKSSVGDGADKVTYWTESVNTAGALTITFAASKLPADVAGKTISIYYTAVLNTNAAIAGDGNANTADLTYSEYVVTPSYPVIRTDDEAEKVWDIKDTALVYTYKFDITKVKDTADGNPIENVEFEFIYEKDGSAISLIDEGDGVYRMPTAAELADDDVDKIITLVTPASGKIVVKGLESRTYYLKETKTVDGYNLLNEPFEIDLNVEATPTWKNEKKQDGQTYTVKDHDSQTFTGGNTDEEDSFTSAVINKKGFTLPRTGTMGPVLFILIGMTLVAGGLFVLFGGKKRTRA